MPGAAVIRLCARSPALAASCVARGHPVPAHSLVAGRATQATAHAEAKHPEHQVPSRACRHQLQVSNHTFEVFAIETDPAFHPDYATRKGVTLLLYAAWVKNDTLSFEINGDPGKEDEAATASGRGMGRIHPTAGKKMSGEVRRVQAFDFPEWLKRTVSEQDYVVMKMDVEGTEFDLIPRRFDTGAICLVDEVFLECHYNRWQKCCPGERSPKYQNIYEECLELFSSPRESGILVHQWF
ncbi:hypothetical protein ZWY2020_059394 [Hordeum vulgare]|nr:hypothetical protein ZWY2020_059394 [Hordeum vulgare]